MANLDLAVQKAILDALAGLTAPGADGTVAAVPVYDEPPANAAMPFVTLASQTTTPADTLDASMNRHFVYLSVWSAYRGQRQVLAVLGAIKDRLHDADLPLEAGVAVLCRVIHQATSREPDGITFQGAMTVTVVAAL